MTEELPPYGDTPDTSFESQYKRLLKAAGCGTQPQLAALLEIRQSSISDARRRKIVPPEWLVTLCAKKLANPEWVRTGTGARYLKTANASEGMPGVARVVEVRPPNQCSAQDLVNELVRRALQRECLERQRIE